jgi:hypothetical protein
MPSLRVSPSLIFSSRESLDNLPTPFENTLECDAPISQDDVISIQTRTYTAKLTSCNHSFPQEGNADEVSRSICDRWAILASWIHRIPPEILIQIFLQRLETSTKSPPWYLSHVCRAWREIALRTPQLWTRIPLPALSNRIRVAEALVSFLPEYISRSKDQAISFDWEGNWDPDGLEEEDLFEDPICGQSHVILDILIQHAERWGRVVLISGRWTSRFEYQLAQLHNRLPRLYHLELDVNNPEILHSQVFQAAPHLVEVKFLTPFGSSGSERIHDFIRWNQLSSLKLTIPSSSILPQLDLCQHLANLDLEYVGPEVATLGVAKLELPHLKLLSLHSPSDLSSSLFELLSFPFLRDLRVFSILAQPEPFGSFLRFLERHAKSLQRLTIGHIRFMYFQTSQPETRIDFPRLPFTALRHLSYLQLRRPPLDKLSSFLRAIARDIIPQLPLHTLHITLNDITQLPHTYIKQVSDELREVVLWSENPFGSRRLRRIIINPGESNDYWEFLTVLEGWPQEYSTNDMITAFMTLRGCEKTFQEIYPFSHENKERVIVNVFDEDETRKMRACLDVMLEFWDVKEVHLLYVNLVFGLGRTVY